MLKETKESFNSGLPTSEAASTEGNQTSHRRKRLLLYQNLLSFMSFVTVLVLLLSVASDCHFCSILCVVIFLLSLWNHIYSILICYLSLVCVVQTIYSLTATVRIMRSNDSQSQYNDYEIIRVLGFISQISSDWTIISQDILITLLLSYVELLCALLLFMNTHCSCTIIRITKNEAQCSKVENIAGTYL